MLNWLLGRPSEAATQTADPADAQRYVDSVATLPRPVDQQIAEFVEYLSAAHSWYKHLPLLPPGIPFTIYLDPNAGREWIDDGSRSGFRDRLETTPENERFHYTWQPTSEYIAQFGYLTYFADAGTSFRVPMKKGVLNTAPSPRIQVENHSWVTIPEDVSREGTVYLTGVIHPIAQRASSWIMMQHLTDSHAGMRLGNLAYDESTLDDIVRTAIDLLRRAFLNPDRPLSRLEIEELEQVLPAWAQIQKRQMSQAIHRMLDCIYAGRISQSAV